MEKSFEVSNSELSGLMYTTEHILRKISPSSPWVYRREMTTFFLIIWTNMYSTKRTRTWLLLLTSSSRDSLSRLS